jgi:hypothetical protein
MREVKAGNQRYRSFLGNRLMKFEWDEDKAAANLRKHGVSFAEASTAFADDLSLTGNDPDHSRGSISLSLLAYHLPDGYWLSLM